MKFTSLLLSLAATLTLQSQAFAAHSDDGRKQFEQTVEEIVNGAELEIRYIEVSELPAGEAKRFQEIAEDQANVWHDTILEGDYQLKPDAKLELVEIEEYLDMNATPVAYRITYSHAAWATGSCDVDYDSDEPSYEDCTEGAISESTFVSWDLKHFETDPNGYADFND